MKDILRDMPYFVEVARQKSFTKAAEILDVPISTLSRRISALEKALGAPLFLRTTRSVELTENGERFFTSCEFIIREAEGSMERLRQDLQQPSGRVRISLMQELYFVYLRGSFSEFALKYPDIQLQAHFSTRWVDLLTEPFDLELRVGSLPDSSLVARRLGTIRVGLYAAPSLLEKIPPPEHPLDLAELPFILPDWQLSTDSYLMRDGEKLHVVPKARHTTNSQAMTLEFALAGLGLAGLVEPVGDRFAKRGRLVRLLPDWEAPSVNISAVMPTAQPPMRVRLLIDHLLEHFNDIGKPLPIFVRDSAD